MVRMRGIAPDAAPIVAPIAAIGAALGTVNNTMHNFRSDAIRSAITPVCAGYRQRRRGLGLAALALHR
jgi:hypothetical protein